MKKPGKNMAASVRTRLLNISRAQAKPFDEVMTLYMLERLLYRLSKSSYRDNFVLKGGLLLCVLFADQHRTTKDADFLVKQIAGQMDNIARIFQVICAIEEDDGLIFNAIPLVIILILTVGHYMRQFLKPSSVEVRRYERDAAVFRIDFCRLEDKQKQWGAFLKRTIKTQLEFEQVMGRIRDFLLPVYAALLDETEFFGHWSVNEKQWKYTQ